MLTPMIMIGLLVAPYGIARLLRLSTEKRNLAGVLGLSLVFVFTGVGHFLETEAMAQMIPWLVPKRPAIIRVSGVIEIVAALALLVPPLRHRIGWFLILLLVFLLPFNIYAAVNRVPMGGHEWGPVYLLIRVPLQVILMIWVYRFATHSAGRPS